MMIIEKKSYIFGRNAGECSFLGLSVIQIKNVL